MSSIAELLKKTKNTSFAMANLSIQTRNRGLALFSKKIIERSEHLLAENQKDLNREKGNLSASLFQRLALDLPKLESLSQGALDLASFPDLLGRSLLKRKLDDDLILEKVVVPIGVIGIVFESRPDVIPQILSLALKTGNAVVLKGGKEALCSNRAFMEIVEEITNAIPELPKGWATLIETREGFKEILSYPQYVDLVIPRGSNQLVQEVMRSTQIPVLGHADGICHIYVHADADIHKAVKVIKDSKAQYPSACNAVETLLVDQKIAEKVLPILLKEAEKTGIQLLGCHQSKKILPQIQEAQEQDWSTEYGDLRLSVRITSDLSEAIDHINHYGSHHTDGIITENAKVGEDFCKRVDSASVFINASTRFADGYRYGFGAEVGISTSKTHARGPVGIEGLVIYKYILKGNGQVVADYSGKGAKKFKHEDLD